jgi:hypothetical protein
VAVGKGYIYSLVEACGDVDIYHLLFEILLFLDHRVQKVCAIDHPGLEVTCIRDGWTNHFLIEEYVDHLLDQISDMD